MGIDVVDLDHAAIEVSDLDAALDFYHELLGMEVRDRDRFERGAVPYVAVVAGGRHIHLVPTDDPADVASDHLCLLVRSSEMETEAEIEALIDELRAAGVTVEDGEPYRR